MILFYVGLAVAAVGTWADHVTTTTALRIDGVVEANPVQRWVMRKTGRVWAATIILNVSIIAGGAVMWWSLDPAAAGLWLVAVGAVKMAAAAGNQKLIDRKRKS